MSLKVHDMAHYFLKIYQEVYVFWDMRATKVSTRCMKNCEPEFIIPSVLGLVASLLPL